MQKILLNLFTLVILIALGNTASAQCAADAGEPVAPSVTDYCNTNDNAPDLEVTDWTTEPSGTENHTFVVTQVPDTVSSAWFGNIMGSTDDGIYDFHNLPATTYCFTSFSYNQSELDVITANTTIQTLAPCLTGGENLDEILACVQQVFGFATIDAAIDSVLGELIPVVIPGFTPCYDITPDGEEYCINVLGEADGCTSEPLSTGTGIDYYSNDQFNITNFPNPFSDVTKIEFYSASNDDVELKVYNMLGTLVHMQVYGTNYGQNIIDFNGAELDEGVYIYTVGNDETAAPNRMIISR